MTFRSNTAAISRTAALPKLGGRRVAIVTHRSASVRARREGTLCIRPEAPSSLKWLDEDLKTPARSHAGLLTPNRMRSSDPKSVSNKGRLSGLRVPTPSSLAGRLIWHALEWEGLQPARCAADRLLALRTSRCALQTPPKAAFTKHCLGEPTPQLTRRHPD